MTLPRTRGDCQGGPRPCTWTRCRHFLPGGLCVLDVVEAEGDCTLERVAELLGGLTRERIRQIEARALAKLSQATGPVEAWRHPVNPWFPFV